MPSNVVVSYSKKYGVDIKEVEKLWDKAKEIARESGHEEDWPYITAILRNMLGGKED